VLLPRDHGAYLALLGDIFDGQGLRDGSYRTFLLKQCEHFEAVFILAGNHEFYRSEYHAGRLAMARMCSEVNQSFGRSVVHFLDCSRFDIPDTNLRILGCTLWSYVGPEQAAAVTTSLNDYTAIKTADTTGFGVHRVDVAETNAWHAKELSWLENEIAQAAEDERHCVIMTHHAPSFHGTCAPRHENSDISSGFCTSLERLLQPPVISWLFGHTHWSSWQRYRSEGSIGIWSTLSGGTDQRPCDAELAAKSLCRASEGDVLVASNQLGAGARGEHRHTRCHPWMSLEVMRDGSHAELRC